MPFDETKPIGITVVGGGITGASIIARLLQHKQQNPSLELCWIEGGRLEDNKPALPNSAGQLHPGCSLPISLYTDLQVQERLRREKKRRRVPEEDIPGLMAEAKKEVLPGARHLMQISLAGCREFRALAGRYNAGPIHDGVMHLAPIRDDAAHMKKAMRALGLDYGLFPIEWYDRNQVYERLQAKRQNYHGGYFYPTVGGYFDAPVFYQKLVAGISKEGVPLVHNCKAQEAERDDTHLRVRTSQGVLRTRYLIMANAFAAGINPKVIRRVMRYYAYAFKAKVNEGINILQGHGAFEEEADPFLYVTRIGDTLTFGYADTAEKQDKKGRERLEAKAVARIEKLAPWLEGKFHEWIQDSECTGAPLSVTGSCLPDVSNNGNIYTATGLSGIGHSMGAAIGRALADHVAGLWGCEKETQSEKDYTLLCHLPKGKDMASKEKADYLARYLNPSEPIALGQRSPSMSLHI